MNGLVLIFIGSGLGGVMRHLLNTSIQSSLGDSFPFGTFAVNMLGCLIIGFLAQISETRILLSVEARMALFVGVLGGFTTFSSFGLETVQLLRNGHPWFAIGNAAGQVVLGLLCVWLGLVIGSYTAAALPPK